MSKEEMKDRLIKECLDHIKDMGNIIRTLDEEYSYSEYWLQDGGHTMFTKQISERLKNK